MKSYYNACKLDKINHSLRRGTLASDKGTIKKIQNNLDFETEIYTIFLNGKYILQLEES